MKLFIDRNPLLHDTANILTVRFILNKVIYAIILVLLCTVQLYAQSPKSPTRAALYSAVLPGGGQIYNHAYAKAGVVWGVQAYLIGRAIVHDDKVDEYRNKRDKTSDEYLKMYYDTKLQDYKEMRTSDFWWMGATTILSVLDAYVDAHLSNFDAEKARIHLLFDDDKLTLQYRF